MEFSLSNFAPVVFAVTIPVFFISVAMISVSFFKKEPTKKDLADMIAFSFFTMVVLSISFFFGIALQL